MQKTSRPEGRSSAMFEIKAFPLEVKDFADDGRVKFYASTFGNVDLDGDIMESGAFTKTIKEQGGLFPMLWQHDRHEPIGVADHLKEDSHGLLGEAAFNLDVQRGREALSLAKQGALRGFSVGIRTVKSAWQGSNRRLQEVKLYEISAVTLPANPEARLVDAKSAALALDHLAVELKAGRTLSTSNLALLQSALEALQALHLAAQPPTEGTALEEGAAADDADASSKSAEPGIDPTRAASVLRDVLRDAARHPLSTKG